MENIIKIMLCINQITKTIKCLKPKIEFRLYLGFTYLYNN